MSFNFILNIINKFIKYQAKGLILTWYLIFRYCEQNNNCWGYLVELVPDESHDLYMNVVNFTHTLISVEPFKYKNKHAWTITIARE